MRAPTPTGAATLVVPDRRAVQADVAGTRAALAPRRRGMRWKRGCSASTASRAGWFIPAARLAQQRRDAAALAGRLDRAYRNRLAAAADAMRELGRRLAWLLRQPLPQAARLAPLRDAHAARGGDPRSSGRRARIAALEQSLAHLNPQAVLERGYAIVTTADGAIVDDAAKLAVGDDVALAFARGSAGAKITRRD